LLSCRLAAQEVVSFTYDASGNRTSRFIILEEKETDPESTSDTTYLKQNEIKEEEPVKYLTVVGEKAINIYPNPNGGMFKVVFEGWTKELNGSIQLHSLSGNLIFEMQLLQQEIDVNITDQPDGTYLLIIMIDGKKEMWKIIKK